MNLTSLTIEDELHVVQQKAVAPRSELLVLIVSTAAGLQIIDSKPVAREIEKVTAARGVLNISTLIPF